MDGHSCAELKLSGNIFIDRPKSYSATHCKTVYSYCAEIIAHGLDLISPVVQEKILKIGQAITHQTRWICPTCTEGHVLLESL